MSEMIEERAPVENEKEITPTSIMMIPKILSVFVVIGMSPYPTVVIV